MVSKRRLRRRQLLYGMTTASAAVVAGCADNEGSTADDMDDDTADGELSTLNVGNIEGATLAPFMVAEERGLFEEQGIQVEAQTFVNPSDLYQAIQIGEIDFAYATSPFPVARAKNDGADISIISYDMESNFFMIGKTEYDSVEELEGQQIGNLPPGSSTHFGWSVAIEGAFDQSFDEFFDVVAMGPAPMATTLLDGEIEAGTLWAPFTVEIMAKEEFHLIESLKEVYQDGTGHNPIFAVGAVREPYFSEHESEIRGFHDAIDEAAQMIEQNPDIMVDVGYVDIFGIEAEEEIELLKDELSGMYPVDYDPETVQGDLQFQFEQGVELGQIDEMPDEDIYNFL